MKNYAKCLMALLAVMCSATAAQAQYYSIVNQATSMLQTALTGGFRYRGFVDASYNRGLGDNRADMLEFSTTQGVKYADWFFMGVGAGVDVMFAHPADEYSNPYDKSLTETACMVPLFTEFRFNIGGDASPSFFIAARVGASFLIGKDYLQVGDGHINRSECFYFKPIAGLRIPVSGTNPKQAFNIGASYTLITTEYWSGHSRNLALSSMGISIGFEW